MPYKDLLASYRVKNGIRYRCWGDFFTKDEARGEVTTLRHQGGKAFLVKIDDFWRVFVA